MNPLLCFVWPISEAIVERLGWVLVHSLWQFAFVALAAGVARRAMRHRAATTRYTALVVAMAMSVALPLATWMLQAGRSPIAPANPAGLTPDAAVNVASSPEPGSAPLADRPLLERDSDVDGPVSDDAASSAAAEASPGASPRAAAITDNTPSWSERVQTALRPWLAWMVVGWGVGVTMCSLRPLLGWHTLRRLRRVGVSQPAEEVLSTMRSVAQRLGLRPGVRVLQSTLAQVPVVVGYLRPVILLPVSLVSAIPAAQLEAILAHELAHVRRHDFVVNLLQTLVETFFFYHPAVWWLSRQIRIEREHCCDDLVVALLGNRVDYGRALVAIELCRGGSPVLALGAADGSLLSRVRRISGMSSERTPTSQVERWPAAMLAMALIAVAGVMSLTWKLAAKDKAEPSGVRVRNADGSPVVFNNVVQAMVGYPTSSPDAWVASPNRQGVVLLEGLPDGTHWLLAAGDSPGRLPFPVTIPTKQALLEVRLRSPAWWGKKFESGRQPVVEINAKAGEVIVIEIHNQSSEALSFSEADIVLGGQCEQELIRGLSPKWLTAEREPFPQTRIEAGQTGRMRLNWREWARNGLWSSRQHEVITEPGFPPAEPGKVWIKAGVGNANSLPVSVTDPKDFLARAESQPPPIGPPPEFGLGQRLELLQWSHDSKEVFATGSFDTFELWRRRGVEWVPTSLGADHHLNSITASRRSPLIVVGTNVGTAEVWDATNRKRQCELRCSPEYGVYSVAISPDENLVAACGTDGTVVVFDRDSQQLITRLGEKADTRMVSLAFSPDGKKLAAMDRDGQVVLWNLAERTRLAEWKGIAGGDDCSVQWAPDGRQLGVSGPGRVTLIAADRGSEPRVVMAPEAVLLRYPEDPDSRPISGPFPGGIKFWSVTALAPDLRTAASVAPDASIGIWDLATGKIVQKLPAPLKVAIMDSQSAGLQHLTFSPDGNRLACTTIQGEVVFWTLVREGSLPQEGAADTAGKVRFPPLEFRFAANPAESNVEPRVPADFVKRHYPDNSPIGRAAAQDQGFVWVPVANPQDAKIELPLEGVRGADLRVALLADSSEHALLWDGKWSVENCRVVADPNGGDHFGVEMKLNEAGGKALRALTKSHLDQRLAIIVNGHIIAAPIVRSEIGREVAITGKFTREQAEGLARALAGRAGESKNDSQKVDSQPGTDVAPRTSAKPTEKKERDRLQGYWAVESCESQVAALNVSEWDARRWRWTIKGDQITWGREGQEWKLALKIDPDQTPKQIDLTFLDGPHKGETCLGIYDWDGEAKRNLKILVQDPGAEAGRPASFERKAGGQTSQITLRPLPPIDPVKELALLQGTWCWDFSQPWTWPQPIGVGTDSDGRKSEKRWVINGNQITWVGRDGQRVFVTYTIDPFKTPKQIDFTFVSGPRKGQKSVGIYESRGDGDRIELCMTDPGTDAPRPTDFSAGTLLKQSLIFIYRVAPPVAPSAANELKRLRGVWQMQLCDSTLETFGGTQQEASQWQWTIKDDEILWSRRGDVWKLKLSVDPSKKPRGMDLTYVTGPFEMDLTYLTGPFKGAKCRGIYGLGGVDGQSLMIAIQDPGSDAQRPTSFSMSGDVKTGLMILRPTKPSDIERQIAAFQGTWTLRKFDTGAFDRNKDPSSWPLPGGKGPDESGEGSELKWVVKQNEINWTSPSGEEIKATFTIDPFKIPKRIDLTFLSGPHKGESCPGIYQRDDLDEKILWVCLADPGSRKVRPKEFAYQWGEGHSLLSLYR